MSIERRRSFVEAGREDLSIVRQCELLSLSRSSFYYQPVGESAENLALMRLVDAQFLETPGMALGRCSDICGAMAMTSAASGSDA